MFTFLHSEKSPILELILSQVLVEPLCYISSSFLTLIPLLPINMAQGRLVVIYAFKQADMGSVCKGVFT